MEASIIWLIIMIAVVAVLLSLVGRFVVPALYWLLAVGGVLLYSALDYLFSAACFPRAPWIMWLIWGAVIGGTLGFWTVAPVYGLREQRKTILLIPLIAMALTAVICAMIR